MGVLVAQACRVKNLMTILVQETGDTNCEFSKYIQRHPVLRHHIFKGGRLKYNHNALEVISKNNIIPVVNSALNSSSIEIKDDINKTNKVLDISKYDAVIPVLSSRVDEAISLSNHPNCVVDSTISQYNASALPPNDVYNQNINSNHARESHGHRPVSPDTADFPGTRGYIYPYVPLPEAFKFSRPPFSIDVETKTRRNSNIIS